MESDSEAHSGTDEKKKANVIRNTTIKRTPSGISARLTQWKKYERPKPTK